MNTIINKSQFLASQIINNVDVLLVPETKLDDSFSTAQFLLDGFSKHIDWTVAQMEVEFFLILRMTHPLFVHSP